MSTAFSGHSIKITLRRIARPALALALLFCSLLLSACGGGYRILSEGAVERAVSANEYAAEEQRVFVEAALSLVGKVHYFWGGKYYEVGPCPDWGEPREVTSPGNSTTGTVRPFGLDCSGFVTWCFCQLGCGKGCAIETIGDGTWNQWQKSVPIDRSGVVPGDLAFTNEYPSSRGNHVGVVIALDRNGDPLIAHCTSAENNVVVSTCGSSFVYFRRVSALLPAVQP